MSIAAYLPMSWIQLGILYRTEQLGGRMHGSMLDNSDGERKNGMMCRVISSLRCYLIEDALSFKEGFAETDFYKQIRFTVYKVYYSFSKATCFLRKVVFLRLEE